MWSLFFPIINKTGYNHVLHALQQPKHVMINTLPTHEQDCLIQGTLPYNQEEKRINELMQLPDRDSYTIVVYGKNATDETMEKKSFFWWS